MATTAENDRVVLVVDDSAYARRKIRAHVLSRGWKHVIEASDGDEAIEVFRRERPDLVLVDQVMRGRHGVETAELILQEAPNTRIVMLTVVSDPSIHELARQTGIQGVIKKTDWEALDEVLAQE